jgi:hypothetical protein
MVRGGANAGRGEPRPYKTVAEIVPVITGPSEVGIVAYVFVVVLAGKLCSMLREDLSLGESAGDSGS